MVNPKKDPRTNDNYGVNKRAIDAERKELNELTKDTELIELIRKLRVTNPDVAEAIVLVLREVKA